MSLAEGTACIRGQEEESAGQILFGKLEKANQTEAQSTGVADEQRRKTRARSLRAVGSGGVRSLS